jgi:hypothetical protein
MCPDEVPEDFSLLLELSGLEVELHGALRMMHP